MNQKPCQKEYDEMVKAGIEWNDAAEACKEFLSMEPLDPYEDLIPLSEEETERMIRAYDRNEEAQKKHFDAYLAYSKCLREYT